jgi:hypothetical protein
MGFGRRKFRQSPKQGMRVHRRAFWRLSSAENSGCGGFLWRCERRLKLFFRNIGELLPFRRLGFGDAKLFERFGGFLFRRFCRATAYWRATLSLGAFWSSRESKWALAKTLRFLLPVGAWLILFFVVWRTLRP